MSDIVERLRHAHTRNLPLDDGLMGEAAAEIERLRVERDRLRAERDEAVAALVEAARREEREACAQVVLRGQTVLVAGIGPVDGYPWDNAAKAAAAIRARESATTQAHQLQANRAGRTEEGPRHHPEAPRMTRADLTALRARLVEMGDDA
jgi:hypothetical protein